ncbi:beta strand repeat-containing protein [Flavobacterium sp. 3HN19-14]|uniref:beta strand repeat-containing protein n=1 Tax=Flavobacterium sp. 3HN19-14 TaxID=3448133 RepID=UPI003EE3655F
MPLEQRLVLYSIPYTICEVVHPTNCDGAIITFTVMAPIDAIVDNNPTPISSVAGGVAIANIYANDTLNGSSLAATPALVNLTYGTLPAGITIDAATGAVNVAPGTASGSYSIPYTICEVAIPTNCDSATITFTVFAPIDAVDDITPTTSGTQVVSTFNGGVAIDNIYANDTLNGVSFSTTPSLVNLTYGTLPTGISINAATGAVNVAPNTPIGVYTFPYTICEVANPLNCDTAMITVIVEDTHTIDAVNDNNPTPIFNNVGGVAIANIYGNDSLNGTSLATTPALVNLTYGALPTGITIDAATGAVNVAPGTAACPYSIPYTICEVAHPTNCDSATITFTVIAPIVAVNDTAGTFTSSPVEMPAVLNVFTNDTLNDLPVNPAAVILTVVTPDPDGYITLNPDGTVDLAPNAPTGAYTITYSICEVANPTNCDTALVTVTVIAPIVAVDDNAGPFVSSSLVMTGVLNVFTNDTLNSLPVDPSDVILTVVTPNAGGYITLNPNGTVDVTAGTPAGVYTLTYSICEIASPTNCDTAIVTVTITAPVIDAVDDTVPTTANTAVVYTLTGGTAVANLYANDTLNNASLATTPGLVNLTYGTLPTGITINAATGAVNVAPGTPVGTYTFPYTICQVLNPTNCDTALITVIVVSAPQIGLVKTGVYVDNNLNGVVDLGDTVSYTFAVTNTGGVTLSNLSLSDPLIGIDSSSEIQFVNSANVIVTSVAPGETVTTIASWDLTQAQINSGQAINTATIEGTAPGNITVSDTSDDNSPLPGNDDVTITPLIIKKQIGLVKTGVYVDANNNGVLDLGDSVDYTFTVKNTGNTTVSNIIVTDPMLGLGTITLDVTTLAPGAIATSDVMHYAITQVNITNCQVVNTASATAFGPGDTTTPSISDISDNDSYELNSSDPTVTALPCSTLAPQIGLVKAGVYFDFNGNGIVDAGDTINYTFTVTNTGTVPVSNLVINDPMLIPSTYNVVPTTLNPGITVTVPASYTITQANINTGFVINIATISGTLTWRYKR